LHGSSNFIGVACCNSELPEEDFAMQTNPAKGAQSPQDTTPKLQLQVRTDLRSGALNSDCSLGIQYWRKEYQQLKQIAQSLGCA
jgi:hypothetical protein